MQVGILEDSDERQSTIWESEGSGLIVLIFRGQLQCRMVGKREGTIKAYHKFWILNRLGKQPREILRIPTWMKDNMDFGATPAEEIAPGNYSPGTTRELLQDLNGEEWADTATPPVESPRKNLELQLGSKPVDMGRVFLSNESEEKNTFEGTTMFLDTLDK